MNEDTVKLLKECDAGIKNGDAALKEVMDAVSDPRLKEYLNHCKDVQGQLGREITAALESAGEDGKDPNPVAKGMSWIKTNVKLTQNPTDHTVADVITDGCHMGIKTLTRYTNQYASADSNAKMLAHKLVAMEEQLAYHLRPYL